MAANNYFGFAPHSGTQYAPTGATPYQTTQTGYAVAPTPAAATYTQRAAPAYETYQATAATHTTPGTYTAVPAGSTPAPTAYDYSYAARSAQTPYDTTKTYYQQAPAAATYSTTDYPGAAAAAAAAVAGKAQAQYSATYTTQTTRNTTQVQAQKATAYSTGASAYATQQAQPATNYASASYSTPISQPQPVQNKVVSATLHRNLSTVAEYTQPAPQRQAALFTPKAKKTFHPQTSVTASGPVSGGGGVGPTAAANVTSVATYATGGNTSQQTYGATSTAATNSYTQQNYTPVAASQPPSITKPKSATTYSGYDAALYSAATMYVAQQATPTQSANTAATVKTTNTNWQGYKKNIGGMLKPVRQKMPPKPQQLHYCDVCKISCAGPQTYREHLEGQKHKKKEAGMKVGTAPAVPRAANALKCELCDVTCTGTDAYTAHIRGAKHQKVVKLHTKLGKPIPAADPKAAAAAAVAAAAANSGGVMTDSGVTVIAATTPKINFVASGNLGTVKTASSSLTTVSSSASGTNGTMNTAGTDQSNSIKAEENKTDFKMEGVELSPENDVTPVGLEYIEEILNDEGKTVSFNCKLCECRFNDPNAKGMHMKGRRHRLQYKKKVNPDLVVDVKTSVRHRKMYEEKMRRQAMREEFFRRREEERMMEVEERMYWEERRRYEEEVEYYEWYRRHAGPRGMGPPPVPPPPPYGPPGPPMMGGPPTPLVPPNHPGRSQPFFPSGPPLPPQRRPDSSDDKHVMARHAAIYPKEPELAAVQKIVSHTEKALKLVSDHLTDQATKASGNVANQQSNSNKAGSPTAGASKPAGAATTSPTAPAKQQTSPPATLAIKKEPAAGNNAAQSPRSYSDLNKRDNREDGRSGNLLSFQRDKEECAGRILRSVMRVGVLAKGLLLIGDTAVELVMLCSDKPTKSLLCKVATNLLTQLKVVAPDETYTVVSQPEEAAIVVATSEEPKITVTVSLTSPIIREQLIAPSTPETATAGDGAGQAALRDPADILNKTKCLEALAALRHAKWFQARVTGLQSCVIVIRILRDLCQRNPTWASLNSWAMELLVEKVISSAGCPMPPGDALRRIMEALASGILLSSGPGLLDPCEKEQTDAAAGLTPQQREDITASAQHALRLIAFRQIHKVLGMEMLPAPKFNRNHRFTRKRRRDNSNGEGIDSEAGDGKKDKKDEAGLVKMETDKK